MGVHGVAPTFTQGQVMSASAHLNTLQAYVQGLGDSYLGPRIPYHGLTSGQDPIGPYSAYIRHKQNTVSYRYDIRNSGTVELRINNVVVPGSSNSGVGTYTGTDVDISSLSLTVGEFYQVTVVGEGAYTLWYFAETRVPSLPTLAAFTNETTPTGTQWQDLSDYANELDTLLSAPQQLGNTWVNASPILTGVVDHRARYLVYNIRMTAPWWGDNSIINETPYNPSDPWHDPDWDEPSTNAGNADITGYIKINGVLALRLMCGKSVVTAEGVHADGYYYRNVKSRDVTFEGQLDLDTYPVGSVAPYNQAYDIQVTWDSRADGWDRESNMWLNHIYETPETFVSVTGWTPFVTWAHGNYVRGNTGSNQAVTLKNNLEALGAVSFYRNYPTRQKESISGFYSVRRWRWLRYKTVKVENEEGEWVELSPSINYSYRGEAKSVNLTPASDALWGYQDLDAVPGLSVGTYYTLYDVEYALEDAVP